ncbi:MAG: HAD family hydrolase [Pseudomonadales bacterium]
MSDSLKVLSFDLDDTLWPVKPVLIGAEKRVNQFLEEHCPEVLKRFDQDAIMQRRIELYKQRPDLHHQISQFRIEAVYLLIRDAGYSEQDARRLTKLAFELFIEARHDVTLYEGVEETLVTLKERFQLVALTNGNADVMRLAISHLFDFGIKAEDINSSKPAAAHFELALQRAGIDAHEMLHVGDNPEHDVLGAQQLGIPCVWINAKGEPWPHDQEPDLILRSVNELPDAIKTL